MAASDPPWEYIDHTADLGVRARGATLGEAFANAAEGLFSYIIESDDVQPRGEVTVEVSGDDADDVLLRWLEELLYVQQVDLVAYAGFEAEVIPSDDGGAWRLEGTATGEEYDRDRHGHFHEVKAITYHGIKVQQDPPEVEVIVDI